MESLKILAIENYQYKGVDIQRIDSIEEGFSTLSAFPKRKWFVNGKLGFTLDYNGEIKLGVYLGEEASKGGERTILVDFTPNCDFHLIDKDIVESAMNELGKYIEHEIVESEY